MRKHVEVEKKYFLHMYAPVSHPGKFFPHKANLPSFRLYPGPQKQALVALVASSSSSAAGAGSRGKSRAELNSYAEGTCCC